MKKAIKVNVIHIRILDVFSSLHFIAQYIKLIRISDALYALEAIY